MMTVFRYTGLFMPPRGAKPGPPEPPLVDSWIFVNSTSAGGSVSGGSSGVTLNTIGATDLFLFTLALNVTAVSINDSAGNIWVNRNSFGTGAVGQLRLYTATKPIHVSANHSIGIDSGYPAMAVFAFQHLNSAAQFLGDGRSDYITGTAIGLSPPLVIPFPASLVVSAYGDNNWSTPPIMPLPELTGIERVPITAYQNGNLVAGFKILDEPATEYGVWTVNSGGVTATISLGAFEG